MLLYTNNQANQNKRHITYHAHSISQTFTAYNPYKIIINLSFSIINTPLNHLLSTRSKKVVRLKECFLFKVFFKLLAFWGCILLVVFQSNNVQPRLLLPDKGSDNNKSDFGAKRERTVHIIHIITLYVFEQSSLSKGWQHYKANMPWTS